MKVKDLRQLLEGLDEDMDVLIPMTDTFDGYWKHPCLEESGPAELGMTEEEYGPTETSFVLVPCGFFEEHEGPEPELN